ncbi:MAG: glycosyltransferase family 39 protein, partial [Actinobacteria bacterium]|nr:glycosyltransferase family 39 protein [Actinomycetota bacterium]
PAGLALMALAVLGCAGGLAAGVGSGPLWLDETLSVEIARLPLPDLYAGLRQDGAPPVYYLLLKAWMALVGTGTVAVRLLTVLFVPVALLLAHRLGGRLAGVGGARAAVIVLAALPWTMRYGSETRMYLLVVVEVLAGALLLERVRRSASRGAFAALGAVTALLLLTHYWSLFLLAVVGAWCIGGGPGLPSGSNEAPTAPGFAMQPATPILAYASDRTSAGRLHRRFSIASRSGGRTGTSSRSRCARSSGTAFHSRSKNSVLALTAAPRSDIRAISAPSCWSAVSTA